LVRRDHDAIKEALELLDKPLRRRLWYVLEGESKPDACIETDRLLLVVEGKRTERQATITTSWMGTRSQILRHMDAAWEVKGMRRVFGLMIVEGSSLGDQQGISPHWLRETEAQISEEMLASSLPHRSPQERRTLAEGFLGVTTWQRVCSEFDLLLPDER